MARICKVLIVENDEYINELLGEIFEEEGFEFTIVETGAEMEDKIDEDDYDIVMIDVTQPGEKDGFSLAEIAHAQGCGVDPDHGRPSPFRKAGEKRTLLSVKAVPAPRADDHCRSDPDDGLD